MQYRNYFRRAHRAAAGLLATLFISAAALAATLKQIAVRDLPGPPGKRFDYLSKKTAGRWRA